MILIYIYCLLGIIGLSDINYYKKIGKSELEIIECNNVVVERLYGGVILILLLLNFIYNIIENDDIYNNIFRIHYIIHYIILKIKFKKLIIYKIYENDNFYNISLICQLIIIILSIIYIIIYNISLKEINEISIIFNIIDIIGLCIYYNSILIFILLFTKLLQELYILDIKINDIIEKENKGLMDCYSNIIELKYKSSKYIGNFNYIFNFFTLINILLLLIIINDIQIDKKKKI